MLMFKRKKELQSLVNSSRKSLARAEEKITERNKLLEYQHKTIEQLKSKITDLENNIELLVNNSTDTKIKELVNDYQSIN